MPAKKYGHCRAADLAKLWIAGTIPKTSIPLATSWMVFSKYGRGCRELHAFASVILVRCVVVGLGK